MSSTRGSASPPTKKGVAKVVKPKKGYSARNRNTWTVAQLKAECKARGLKVGGRKDELLVRLQVNDDTKKEAAGDEDSEDEHEDEEAAEEDTVDAEKGVEKTPEAEATTSEPDPTAPPKADKGINVSGIENATMSKPYVEKKPADRPRTIRKPQTKRIGADGHPLFRKPARKIAAGGKPMPKNGYKALPKSASPSPVPGFKAKRVEIERAIAYRKAVMKIVEQIMEDNGDDDEMFSDAVNQLGKARDELSKIAKAEVVDGEVEEVEEAEDDADLVDDDEEVHEHVEDPEDGDFSDGSREMEMKKMDLMGMRTHHRASVAEARLAARRSDGADKVISPVVSLGRSLTVSSTSGTVSCRGCFRLKQIQPHHKHGANNQIKDHQGLPNATQAASTPSPKITKKAPLKTKAIKTSRLAYSLTGYSPTIPEKSWESRMYHLAIQRNHGGKKLKPTAAQIHEARHARRVQQELRNLIPKVHGIPISNHVAKTLRDLVRILDVFAKEPTGRDLKRVNYDGIPDRPI
ncbi:hypothetical protein LTR86_006225 [Recurvomyces mirabilis]|nr:hypothetical protein LTR86_006225 [Recurvomyces mirabilis]